MRYEGAGPRRANDYTLGCTGGADGCNRRALQVLLTRSAECQGASRTGEWYGDRGWRGLMHYGKYVENGPNGETIARDDDIAAVQDGK